MDNKTIKTFFSIFLIVLYAAIILVLLFLVLKVNEYEIGTTIIIFQGIGILILIGLMLLSNYIDKIHIGHKISIITATATYLIALHVLTVLGYTRLLKSELLLANLILLTIYFLSIVPMVYMGVRNKN